MLPSNKLDIGIDDAGRGTLCGPLVIAAVYHPVPVQLQYLGATDSKNTKPVQRADFVRKLGLKPEIVVATAAAAAGWINQCGVDNAEATIVRSVVDQMVRALGTDYTCVRLLVDGKKSFPNLPQELEVHYFPRGDGYIPLIAAASMVATATHDTLMAELQELYPDWPIGKTRGYHCQEHIEKLYALGPVPGLHLVRASCTSVTSYAIKRGLPLPSWLLIPRSIDHPLPKPKGLRPRKEAS